MKDLKGTWVISQTYVDPKTKLLLTETNRVYGKLHDAYENTLLWRNCQDLRIQFYSPDDLTST